MSEVTELERLVVRLVGDGSDYKKTLNEATSATEKAVKDIEQFTKAASSSQNKALSEAAQITRSVVLPLQKYSRELQNTKKAATAIISPIEQYKQGMDKLKLLHKEGKIGHEEYKQTLKNLSKTIPLVQAAQTQYNEELTKAKSITASVKTPVEQYKQNLSEVEKLYKSGMISGETYTRAVNNLNKEFNQGSYALDVYGKKMQSIGRSIRNFGAMATIAVTLPVVGMVKSFGSFDDAMTQSTAIMGNVSAEMRREMEQTARTLSLTTKTSATDLAESYYFLASAAMNVVQSVAALPVVEKFATAGAFDMAQATDLLTDAQSALGLSSKDAEKNMQGLLRVSDVLVKANTLANASVQQFSEALTNEAGAAIKQYNMDLSEGVGILAAYADQGIKGNVAGSMFGRMIRLLIKSINDNRDAFETMNVPIEEFSKTGKNVTGVIEGITKATENLGPAEKAAALEALGFEARTQQAILPLLGATDKIKNYTKELDKAGGITKEVADKQLKSFSSQMKILKNNVIDLGVEIGKTLAPYIEKAGNLIREMLEYWRGLGDGVKNTIAIIAGVAAVLAPVITILGTITAAVGGLMVVMGAAFTPGAIVAFTAALSTALPVVLAVVAGMAALGAATKAVLGLNKDLNKISQEEKKQKELSAINREMQELIALQKEQKDIQTRLLQLKAKGSWYDPDELAQTYTNIEAITESIKQLNIESQKVGKEDSIKSLIKDTKDLIAAVTDQVGASAEEKRLESYVKALEEEIKSIEEASDYIKEIESGLTQFTVDNYKERAAASIGFTERMKQNEYYTDEAIKQRLLNYKKLQEEGLRAANEMRFELKKLEDLYKAGAFDSESSYDKAIMNLFKKESDKMPSLSFGSANELDRLDVQQATIEGWYNEQLEMLQEFRNARADLTDKWDNKEQQLAQQHANAINKIEVARMEFMLSTTSTMFQDMATAAENFGNNQTVLYRVLFAASKAFSIAEATLNMFQAISDAGTSQTYPQNLAAMAVVGAKMAALLASISAVGMADSGIQSIPESGSWYLKKGERVVTEETSAKLDRTLDDIQDTAVSVPMNVNIYEAPGTTALVTQRNNEDIDVQIELVEDRIAQRMSRGTGLAKYFDSRYGRRY